MDLSKLEIVGGSPDVRHWPETATITSVSFMPSDFSVRHTKENGPDAWPNVTPPGWDGPLQYTLWAIITTPSGRVVTTGCVEFWKGRTTVGGPFSNAAKDWYYFAPEFEGYQPRDGEAVGFFVTAGDERRKDVESVQERSNIVFVTVKENQNYTYTFGAAPVPTPAPAPVDPPQPVPTPVPLPPSTLARKVDLDATEARLMARFDKLEAQGAAAVAYLKPLVDWLVRWFAVGKTH